MQLNWNPPRLDTKRAIFSWGADHAEEVHNGEVLLGGLRKPDRPYTTVTISEADVAQLVADEYDGDISAAFRQGMEQLGERFKDTIETYRWDIPSTGNKWHKDAPNWVTIDDSGELKESQNLEFE